MFGAESALTITGTNTTEVMTAIVVYFVLKYIQIAIAVWANGNHKERTVLTTDRKTIRYPDGAVELKCSVNDAVMQLADYEDTGRTPEEVELLIQDLDVESGSRKLWMERYYNLLADRHNTITEHIEYLLSAEQENRLIVLPHKVGDTVWSAEPFKDGKPRKGSIVQINIDAGGFCGFWVSFNPEPVTAEFTLEEIGKTVFFTHPEVI